MVQNRNALLDLFIGNISNAIVHKILEEAIDVEDIAKRYEKELMTSFTAAMKLHPVSVSLPQKDQEYVRKKILQKVNSELHVRISHGYTHISLKKVPEMMEIFLRKAQVTDRR